jgi:hypothetical protein
MKDGTVPTADAQRLAKAVASRPDTYRYAIRECLPQLPALRDDP